MARIRKGICLAGWSRNLSVCHLRRCLVGVYRCKRTHWRCALPMCPPASLTAVCCAMWSPRCSLQNNPHSYTHEGVHLVPRAQIKSQNPYRRGDTVVVAFNRFESVRYCCTSSILSVGRPELRRCTAESHLAVTGRWNGKGLSRISLQSSLLAEQSEEDLFTLAEPQAHADNSKAPAWQERHQHCSPASQLAMFIQSK